MSAEESAVVAAPAPVVNPQMPATTSSPDLAALIHQMQAIQAQQEQAPVVPPPPVSTAIPGLEALLASAALPNLGAGLNPLSMLALTSTLNQSSPVYQGIARVLLTMNMNQMLATHQTSELLTAMNQQESLMALLAARNQAAVQTVQQQLQQQSQQQDGFAVPQGLPQMSLKRSNKDLPTLGAKKSCPPPPLPSVPHATAPPPAPPSAPRTPTPPRKSMFENLPPEMKEKNEIFRKEILRRLDIILLEELADDEEDEEEIEKKPDLKDLKRSPTSEEDDTTDETKSMGAAGSAFRRILSRSSTIGNNSSSSPSASGTTSPSVGSLSSGLDSPPLDGESLTAEFSEMLREVALKHRQQATNPAALAAKISDDAAVSQNFPMVWTGRLALKSTEAMINLHLINGSETFLNGVLGRQLSADNPRRDSMKIMQRLRLDNGQVEHVHRILTNPDYACCLALSSVTDIDSLARSDANLKASFIDYLTNKQIAGISSLEEIESRFRSARVHVFAPGDIVNKYLSELAPPLHDYLQTTDTHYLLIVFTNDKLEPNMSSPPTTTSLAVPQPSN